MLSRLLKRWNGLTHRAPVLAVLIIVGVCTVTPAVGFMGLLILWSQLPSHESRVEDFDLLIAEAEALRVALHGFESEHGRPARSVEEVDRVLPPGLTYKSDGKGWSLHWKLHPAHPWAKAYLAYYSPPRRYPRSVRPVGDWVYYSKD